MGSGEWRGDVKRGREREMDGKLMAVMVMKSRMVGMKEKLRKDSEVQRGRAQRKLRARNLLRVRRVRVLRVADVQRGVGEGHA
eukprot:6194753-Pleurochrysis_carterae.AAC.1